ncbi:MAG: tRNA (guanosine(37)-N1)-methyltransferase TrmD [Bacteroides sp.]|nr:MAG: tRNA (guanosine(37)-N1)-methyltransferase TrmD [Bacteroides sp.]
MLNIDIITIFPDFFNSIVNYSTVLRSIKMKKLSLSIHNLRNYSVHNNGKIDDYCYGGISGMVLMIEPIANCIDHLLSIKRYDDIIYLSPDGNILDQNTANELSIKNDIIIICGHYKGIDQRIRDKYVSKEISVGDYILSGGEIPATIIINAISRLIPGVVNSDSIMLDSFQNGMLEAPIYTRPYNFKGLKVPDILLSGNRKKIDEWIYKKSIIKTKNNRPDLLK